MSTAIAALRSQAEALRSDAEALRSEAAAVDARADALHAEAVADPFPPRPTGAVEVEDPGGTPILAAWVRLLRANAEQEAARAALAEANAEYEREHYRLLALDIEARDEAWRRAGGDGDETYCDDQDEDEDEPETGYVDQDPDGF